MDYKHFSHSHGLIPHQVPQGSQISCSGCRFQGTGLMYACWPCNYFLHEQCYHAPRSMNHPSHTPHPLALVPYPTYPSGSFYCNSCTLIGSGFSYSCPNCEFDIHVHCAYIANTTTHELYPSNPNTSYPTKQETIPQNNPPPLGYPQHDPPPPPLGYPQHNPPPLGYPQHNGHTDGHTLPTQTNQQTQVPYSKEDQTPVIKSFTHFTHEHPLLVSRIREGDSTTCSCCEEIVSGTVYSCTKSNCDFYLHEFCFGLAREIRHESHTQHPLTLLAAPAYKEHNTYACNACLNTGTCFVYHCKICQYDLHTSCASLPKTKKRQDHEHPLILMYSSPYKKEDEEEDQHIFGCDACGEVVDDRCWVYYCQKCDFGTHTDCSRAKTCFEEQMSLEEYAQILKIEELGRKSALELWD